jgi:hypothetical protein
LKAELEKERARNRRLVGRIGLIEASVGRLGIDPKEWHRAADGRDPMIEDASRKSPEQVLQLAWDADVEPDWIAMEETRSQWFGNRHLTPESKMGIENLV